MSDLEKSEENSPQMNSLDCWDYSIELEYLRGSEDLQLAAELGKTLLERNKELETNLKQHQNIIEDQTQEIEYLTKQTVALREVNDSRLRIYEQLEVSIHDLERANHRLTLDNAADKKQIKNLCGNVDTLEGKCEELQASIDSLRLQLDTYKRKCQQQSTTTTNAVPKTVTARCHVAEQSHDKQVQCDSTSTVDIESSSANSISTTTATATSGGGGGTISNDSNVDTEHINLLMTQLRDIQIHHNRDLRRIAELEEQLATLVQDNQALESQLLNISTKEEDMKNMHEELTTLDEVRQGQMCSRCLRNMDDISILDPEDEYEDLSMMDALNSETRYHSSVSLNIQQETNFPATIQSNNLYRDLVEKYEALLAVNRNHKPANCMSLHEELQMSGDFSNIHAKDTDEESGHGDSYTITYEKHVKANAKDRKIFSHTPTDFSEAETSSSGFADETSNKSTQTDGRPGSFLCTIADGEDCKFSIYDDASPIDSRFRNRPEYRELFKEIFTVLKKAAENKDEGEQLPLLDDCTPVSCVPKVPPVTPATEDFPGDFTDDNHSIISCAMSDVSSRSAEPQTVVEHVLTEDKSVRTLTAELKEPASRDEKEEKSLVLTPYRREPLEYLSVAVNVRKKSSSKKNKKQFAERSDSPVLPLSPRISYLNNSGGGGGNNNNSASGGRRRKDQQQQQHQQQQQPPPPPLPPSSSSSAQQQQPQRTQAGAGSTHDNGPMWNGTTLQFWSSNRNVPSPTPSQNSNKSYRYEKSGLDFKPSTASQDLNKLKRLDLSYAEVLRNADNKKREVFAKTVRRK